LTEQAFQLQYEGSKAVRIYYLFLFLSGEVFLFYVFCVVLTATVRGDPNVDPRGLLLLLLFFTVWTGWWLYMILNIPRMLIVTDNGLEVVWWNKQRRSYRWTDVELKTIGIYGNACIYLSDQNWRILNRNVRRRITAITKNYKELINEITRRK